MTDILLTTSEVAAQLRVHPNTVRALAARGELVRVKLGRSVRFRPDDIARIIETGVPATACGAAPGGRP
jgi:excisionase family DNA binding protein